MIIFIQLYQTALYLSLVEINSYDTYRHRHLRTICEVSRETMQRISSGGHSRALETLVPPERGKTTVTIEVTMEKPSISSCPAYDFMFLTQTNKHTRTHAHTNTNLGLGIKPHYLLVKVSKCVCSNCLVGKVSIECFVMSCLIFDQIFPDLSCNFCLRHNFVWLLISLCEQQTRVSYWH